MAGYHIAAKTGTADTPTNVGYNTALTVGSLVALFPASLYGEGWELGSPGRPGVRVHFPGTRQEKLAEPDEVYARPAADP